jgi:hypothetical protein
MDPGIMTSPQGFFTQQRLMWGAVLFVGSVLIFYANAPVIPVIIGCLSVPVITAFRSRLRSKNNSSSGG